MITEPAMNDTDIGWLQVYEQSISGDTTFSGGFLHDPSSSIATTAKNMMTPTNCRSKSIRRRSRISKKTSITFLNSNTHNFRTLVQRFTGYRGATPSRRTVNLNISLGCQEGDFREDLMEAANWYNSNFEGPQSQQQQPQPQQQEDQQRQQMNREHENMFSFEKSVPCDHTNPSTFGSLTPHMQAVNDFLLENT